VVLLWILVCAWLGIAIERDGVSASGDLDGLIPVEHREPGDEALLLLETDEDEGDGSTSSLLIAATAVADALGDERVPIAAPRGEMEAWHDAHALYLLPPEAHEDLRQRLTSEAITSAIEDLRARLSSPLHGMMGDDVRRDPLGLGQMMRGRVARATAGRPTGPSAVAEVTPAGDLLAPEGDAMLIALRSSRPPHLILADVEDATGHRISATLIGPTQRHASAHALVSEQLRPLALVTACGLIIVLGTALRAVRPVAAVIACIASGIAGIVLFVGPIDALAVAMLVLLAGFSCEGALHLQRISRRGWPAAAVLGTALVPLLFSPYPQWQTWSWLWLLLVVILMTLLRIVLPALLVLTRGATSWSRTGFELRPMRSIALVVTVCSLGAGVWASAALDVRGADRLDLGERVRPSTRMRLGDAFFDPSLVAEARSHGPDSVAALERAALDVELLSALVPGEAVRIDSPAHAILLEPEIEQRRAALADLDLRDRMRELRSALESRGFRADAFGEFLRGASDLDSAPTAATAMAGPLGPWIERFVEEHADATSLRSRVHLVPDSTATVPTVVDEQGRRVELHGPVVASRRDRQTFRDWLGIYAMMQMWLGAFAVWLGTRSLAIAISSAFAALVTQMGVLVVMLALGQPLGPHMIPAFLLAGAAAMVAAGRSCRAVDLRQPLYAMGLVVTSACQVAAGLALVSTGVPMWTQIGLIAAAGSAIASGVGLFVAPGLTRVLRRSPAERGSR
jgi:hypothetical protein